MGILKHCHSEYVIIMRGDSDMDSFVAGLDKIIADKIITDWEDNELERKIYGEKFKSFSIYLDVKYDTEKYWKKIGSVLGMSLEDLHHAKTVTTKVFRTKLSDIPKGSLWNKEAPDAKPVEDYHGGMITLDRISQLKEDEDNLSHIEWLDKCLLFYLAAAENITDLLQKIENVLLITKEV